MSGSLSVLIRTFNSAATLPQVLARMSPGSGDEIIVVDSGSTDATLQIAATHGARVVTAEQPFNYSRSLNLGFQSASNPWVLVLSSHCVPVEPRYLDGWRGVLEQFPPELAVAYGPVLMATTDRRPGEGREVICLDKMAWKEKPLHGGNGNALYRRACWEEQAFDESLPTAEDLAWMLQSLERGYRIAYVPGRAVLYRNVSSLKNMYRKGFLEAKMARVFLGTEKIRLTHLFIALGSLTKKFLLGRLGLNVFFKQCAHRLGAFRGSRCLPSSSFKLGKD